MGQIERTWREIWSGDGTPPPPRRWTDAQRQFLESSHHLEVLWGGNAIGKSVVLAEIARRGLRGQLPWQRGQPGSVIVTGNTWAQISSTLKYLWAGIEPGEFPPGVRYESGTVKGQRLAIFAHRDGGELRCGTFRARNLAGPRADVVVSDEPLPEDVHAELLPRLLGRNGRMYVTFTPTLGTAGDIDYLWQLVDNPDIPWAGAIQAETTVANCTPRGGLVEAPFLRQAEIDRLKTGVSAIEVDMRLGRSRFPRRDTGYFEGCWAPELRRDHACPSGTPVLVGMDHGSKANAQCAALVYADGMGLSAHYHIADFYMSPGRTEMEQDAAAVLEMLRRNGLARPRVGSAPLWDLGDVDLWIADRSHGGYAGGRGMKSNQDFQRALAQLLGFDVGKLEAYEWREKLPEPLQHIRIPRKRHRSMWDGMDVLRRITAGQRLTVATRRECDPVQEAFERWQGALLDPLRDRLDAIRYAVVEYDSGRFRLAA